MLNSALQVEADQTNTDKDLVVCTMKSNGRKLLLISAYLNNRTQVTADPHCLNRLKNVLDKITRIITDYQGYSVVLASDSNC